MPRAIQPFTKLLLLFSVLSCSVAVHEKHWKLGEEFQRQGQHVRAIEEYSRIVNLGATSNVGIRAQQRIAQIYEENIKDYTKAMKAYRDVFMRSDNNRVKMMTLWAMARILCDKMSSPGLGATEYERLFNEYAKNEDEAPTILLAWAKALMEAGRFMDSATRYAEFRAQYPGHNDGPRAFLEEGKARLSGGDIAGAKKVFQEIITQFTGRENFRSLVAEAYYGLGATFEANEELLDSLAAYEKSLADYPNPSVVQLKIERVKNRKKERKI